jgi:hypothetical protein
MERIAWPDLSAYGPELTIAHLPKGKQVLILRRDGNLPQDPTLQAGENLVDRYSKEATHLGFERHHVGVWLKQKPHGGFVVSTASFTRKLPLTRVVQKTIDEVTVVVDEKQEQRKGVEGRVIYGDLRERSLQRMLSYVC